MENQSVLASVCTEERRVRSTVYSDTYQAILDLNGNVKEYHVTHIGIPFAAEKEEQLLKETGISSEELMDFYKTFGNQVTVAVNRASGLQEKLPNVYEPLLLRVLHGELLPREEAGSDLYIVTEPMVPLIGSALLSEEQSTLLNIYRIASRLILLLKVMGQQGEAIGPMDLQEFYLRNSDDGEQYLVAGPLLYASTDGTPFLTQPTYTAAIQPQVSNPKNDLKMLCVLLWGLFSGNTLDSIPYLTQVPKYAPAPLVDALRSGLAGEKDAMKKLQTELYHQMQKVARGEVANPIIMFHPPEEPKTEPEPVVEQPPKENRPTEEASPASSEPTSAPAAPVQVVYPQIQQSGQTQIPPMYLIMPQSTMPAPTPPPVKSPDTPRKEQPPGGRPVKVEKSSAGLLVAVTIFATIVSIVFIVENVRLWDYYGYDAMMRFFASW